MSTELWNQYLAIRPVAPVEELAAATGWEPGEFKIRLEEGWEAVEGVVSPDGVWGIRDVAPLPSLAGRQLTYLKTGYRISAIPFLTDRDCLELAALLHEPLELGELETASELYRAWHDEHWPEKEREMGTVLSLGALVYLAGKGPPRPPEEELKMVPHLGSLWKPDLGYCSSSGAPCSMSSVHFWPELRFDEDAGGLCSTVEHIEHSNTCVEPVWVDHQLDIFGEVA